MLLFVSLFEETALNALSAIKCLMGREFLDKERKALPLEVKEFQERPAGNSAEET